MNRQLRAIVREVSDATGVAPEAILGTRTLHRIARARAIVYLVARERHSYSYAELAAEFEKSDHSTVRYAIDALSKRLPTDERLRGIVAALTRRESA